MIYDKIENITRYPFLEEIKNFDLKNYQKGKIDINKEVFFGIGLEYDTKNEIECLWEAHQKYLDIHVILEGEEVINISETSTMKQTMEFDYENDYQLFEGTKQHHICLRKGEFLALYPNECHQTAVKLEEASFVKKIVFKIKL
jgi:biofilm protein TabA